MSSVLTQDEVLQIYLIFKRYVLLCKKNYETKFPAKNWDYSLNDLFIADVISNIVSTDHIAYQYLFLVCVLQEDGISQSSIECPFKTITDEFISGNDYYIIFCMDNISYKLTYSSSSYNGHECHNSTITKVKPKTVTTTIYEAIDE